MNEYNWIEKLKAKDIHAIPFDTYLWMNDVKKRFNTTRGDVATGTLDKAYNEKQKEVYQYYFKQGMEQNEIYKMLHNSKDADVMSKQSELEKLRPQRIFPENQMFPDCPNYSFFFAHMAILFENIGGGKYYSKPYVTKPCWRIPTDADGGKIYLRPAMTAHHVYHAWADKNLKPIPDEDLKKETGFDFAVFNDFRGDFDPNFPWYQTFETIRCERIDRKKATVERFFIRQEFFDGPGDSISPDVSDFSLDIIRRWMQDPSSFAKWATSCFFCGKPLTDGLSRELGCGPTCAKNYGIDKKKTLQAA